MHRGLEIPNKKVYMRLIYSMFLLYIITVAVKITYSAQMVEIAKEFSTGKTEVGIGLTIYYVVYGVAQLVLSRFVGRINMRRFIVGSIICSSISFGLIVVANRLWQLWLILALNGVFQSGIFGGCMHFLGKYLPGELEAYASNVMNVGFAVGNIMAYAISSAFVAVTKWQDTFMFFAIVQLLMLVVFVTGESNAKKKVGARKVEGPQREDGEEKNNKASKKAGIVMIVVAAIMFFVTCNQYLVSNWVPNLLTEVYGLPSSVSILITLFVPLGMVVGSILIVNLCSHGKEQFKVSLIMIAIATAVVGLLCFLYRANMIFALILSVVFVVCVRPISSLFGTYTTFRLGKIIEPARLSLIGNAFASIAAAVAPTLSGMVMDNFGWTAYYISIFIFSIVALIVTYTGKMVFERMLNIKKF